MPPVKLMPTLLALLSAIAIPMAVEATVVELFKVIVSTPSAVNVVPVTPPVLFRLNVKVSAVPVVEAKPTFKPLPSARAVPPAVIAPTLTVTPEAKPVIAYVFAP